MALRKILAVDDEKQILNVYETFLKFKGFEIITVENAKDCLEKVKTGKFDLLLLDINMPEINGLQLLEMIRTTKSPDDLPVIIISARGNEENIKKAASLGVDSFLVKPFKMEQLSDRIELELFTVKFETIQEVIPKLRFQNTNIYRETGLRDFDSFKWDAYTVRHNQIDLCIFLKRGVRPSSLALLQEPKARDQMIVYMKHPARWKLAWPKK